MQSEDQNKWYMLSTFYLPCISLCTTQEEKKTKRITEKQHTLRLTQPYLQMKRREETRRRVSRDIPVKGLDGPLPGRLRKYVRIWLWPKLCVSFFFCSHIKLHCWIKRKDLRAKHVWQFMGYIGWFLHQCHHQLCKWVLWISGDDRSFGTSQRNDKFSSFSQSTAQNVHGKKFCFVFSKHLNEVYILPRVIEV